MLHAQGPFLSLNVPLGPKATPLEGYGDEPPDDSGAALYFNFDGERYCRPVVRVVILLIVQPALVCMIQCEDLTRWWKPFHCIGRRDGAGPGRRNGSKPR